MIDCSEPLCIAARSFSSTARSTIAFRSAFTTPPLEPGYSYSYTIRARWTENGRPVQQSRTVPVKAGGTTRVDFTSPPP